jgi:hypothetical protein
MTRSSWLKLETTHSRSFPPDGTSNTSWSDTSETSGISSMRRW